MLHKILKVRTKRYIILTTYCQARQIVSSKTYNGLPKELSHKSEFPAAYNPEFVEAGWYKWWEEQKYFNPTDNKLNKRFTLLLPPPNITGTLHLGHAMTVTVQDIMARWHRMKGIPVLWIPGIDHAGIATQVVVEKKLMKQRNIMKHDLGRENFLNEVWKWKGEKEAIIKQQLRNTGATLDWSKSFFTMDEKLGAAVTEAIIRLHDKGLLYRSNALVNWSSALRSAVSDIEVDMLPLSGPTNITVPGYEKPVKFGEIYEVKYKILDTGEEVVVATTRPETMLGDVALAVHPTDSRYNHLHGRQAWHELRGCNIPIVLDDAVSPAFGTGVLKVTPSHDQTDFEIGKRHDLDVIRVTDDTGCMITERYHGLPRYTARAQVLDFLASSGLLQSTKSHSMSLPVCSRSKDIIELQLKQQWFVSCKQMAERACDAVRSGRLILRPKGMQNVWYTWLDNCRDWNISRQLWWGHRIPMFECTTPSGPVWVAAKDEQSARLKCGQDVSSVRQDEDVLDTWFSSALLPFTAVGWPGSEFASQYPLSLMETGHDILFFWVARMVMLGEELTGELPFNDVLVHGIMCDSEGRKMSKSLGNVVEPETVVKGATLAELRHRIDESFNSGLLTEEERKKSKAGQGKLFPQGIERCGTDALRFTLCSHNLQHSFINFDIQQCQSNSYFCNKIWQSFKFMTMCVDSEKDVSADLTTVTAGTVDQWILSRLAKMVTDVNMAMESYQFHLATSSFRQFFYSEFCDFYLEATKFSLKHESSDVRQAAVCTLFNCIQSSLRILSPIMPFITEELYQRLPLLHGYEKSISVHATEYPNEHTWGHWRNEKLDTKVEQVQFILTRLRALKTFFNIKDKPKANIMTADQDVAQFIESNQVMLSKLSGVGGLSINSTINTHYVEDIFSQLHKIQLLIQVNKDVTTEKLKDLNKKEKKFLDSHESLTKKMSKDRYKSTPLEIQNSHIEKLKNIESEIEKLKNWKNLLKGV